MAKRPSTSSSDPRPKPEVPPPNQPSPSTPQPGDPPPSPNPVDPPVKPPEPNSPVPPPPQSTTDQLDGPGLLDPRDLTGHSTDPIPLPLDEKAPEKHSPPE